MTERITVDIGAPTGAAIAPDLWGLFIEDLNDALDGGLNAERVRNGDFEFNAADRDGWHALTAWATEGDVTVRIDDPVHPRNAHYVRALGPAALANEGWDPIRVTAGDRFRFTCFARARREPTRLAVSIGDGLARAGCSVAPGAWQRIEADLVATADGRGPLRIAIGDGDAVDLDCVSLRPTGDDGKPLTFRPDLLQALKDLSPSFIRFPGGCLAHGLGLANMYHWKDTVGPRHERAQIPNVWGYHQSRQIGYAEYFELCEATGATPLPVVAAGVCCQNTDGGPLPIPESEMDDYIQDVLDLVEYANGPTESPWGAKRAESGHPEPYGLRYLGLGNEDEITADFRDRYARIEDAITKAHPEITVIGTVGPQPAGPDYENGWAYARERGVAMVDEHSYMNPRWLFQNVDRFGSYDPDGPKVYLGEYAGRSNSIRSALAEAAYMAGMERRPEVVRLASYAPLLARVEHTQWVPDLIYFTADEVLPSASYHVQRLFSNERGDLLHPVALDGAEAVPVTVPEAGTAGLRSHGASVEFTDIDLDGSGLPDKRTDPEEDWTEIGGIDPSSCSLSFTATRTEGTEGFIVRLGPEAPAIFLEIHIGGWKNKGTAVLRGDDGITCDDHGPLPWRGVRTGEPVRVAVRLHGPRVRVWVDGELRHDYKQDRRPEQRVVATAASRVRADGATEYVLRLVNADPTRRAAAVTLPDAPGPLLARIGTLAGTEPDEGAPHAASPATPTEATLTGDGVLELDLPPWSFTNAVIGPRR